MLSNYTTPLDESYGERIVPRYYIETITENNRDAELREFVINGDATDFTTWSLTEITGDSFPINSHCKCRSLTFR